MDFLRFCGRLWAGRFQFLQSAHFGVDRRHVAKGGDAALGIVPALNELEGRHPGLGTKTPSEAFA